MRHRYCRVPAQTCGLVTRASRLCHAGKAAAYRSLRRAALALLAVLMLHGCAPGPTQVVEQTVAGEQRIVVPRAIEIQRALALLSQLYPTGVFLSPQGNALVLAGPADQVARMETVLDLIDSPEPYVIETLAPIAAARAVPTNRQIEALLRDVDIGTLTDPPVSTGRPGAIIDIHDEAVVAITPARFYPALLAAVRSQPESPRSEIAARDPDSSVAWASSSCSIGRTPMPQSATRTDFFESVGDVVREDQVGGPPPPTTDPLPQAEPVAAGDEPPEPPETSLLRLADDPTQFVPQRTTESLAADCPECSARESASPPASGEHLTSESIADLYLAPDPCDAPKAGYALPPLANGEDLLQLDLAETVELIDLLDLAAEYLHLDYLCDPEVLAGQTVSLRLHGKLRGEMRKKLQQFEGIGPASDAQGLRGSGGAGATKTASAPVAQAMPAASSQSVDGLMQAAGSQSMLLQPQVIVLETTNSLLVHATEEQQRWIGDLIRRIDVEVRQEAIPYEIYFLENQVPERLAEILQRIIQETTRDKEGKVERVVRSTDDEIMVVPDAGTFSLIVYANRKNQDWISKLIRSLDKRRPQVLIDVTLVEITKTEAFTYDLNWIQSFPDFTPTSRLTGALIPSPSGGPAVSLPGDITSTLAQSGRSSLTDLQSDSGSFRGFYGDEHINVLLQAMASKNYGRVLAKPKVLVNDNEPGSIKTADITYVEVRSSVPVGTGGAGNDVTLIETARKFESYEAGIDLQITPHISEGDLLRLKIELSRSDFLQAGSLERPPDTRANELATAVTVPDGSTIILGGLLKLNQHKSGRKVPILGDIPFVGGLFRGIDNRDNQSSLYIFVKAEIIRPAGLLAHRMEDLEAISDANREAFERREREFQKYQTWPGVKPKPVSPPRVLDAR